MTPPRVFKCFAWAFQVALVIMLSVGAITAVHGDIEGDKGMANHPIVKVADSITIGWEFGVTGAPAPGAAVAFPLAKYSSATW